MIFCYTEGGIGRLNFDTKLVYESCKFFYTTIIQCKAIAHNYDDLIPAERAKYFLNKKGKAPTTWGEAIENRIGGQNAEFRSNADGKGSFIPSKKGIPFSAECPNNTPDPFNCSQALCGEEKNT